MTVVVAVVAIPSAVAYGVRRWADGQFDEHECWESGTTDALAVLQVVATIPFVGARADDKATHQMLRCAGEARLECAEIQHAAEDRARARLRAEEDEALEGLQGADARRRVVNDFRARLDSLDWRPHIDEAERQPFCGRWAGYHAWARSEGIDNSGACPFCDAAAP